MENTRLFSSVVLFRELYDNDKDIYDVIAEFIMSVISYKKLWSFNSVDITNTLKDFFEFDIPEAVIKTTLKNRLEKIGKLKFESGFYTVVSKDEIKEDFEEKIEINNKQYKQFLDSLISYVNKKWGKEQSDKEKDEV